MTTRSARGPRTVCAALLLLPALAACGGSDDGAAAPAASAAPSASAPSASAPSASESSGSPADGGTESPTEVESAQPATGELVTMIDGMTWRLPEGATIDALDSPEGAISASGGAEGYAVAVAAAPGIGDLADYSEKDLLADYVKGTGEVLEPVVVDGVEVAHTRGEASRTGAAGLPDVERFQPPSIDGFVYLIAFTFAADLPEAERSQVIDSVLASVDWGEGGS